VEELKLDARFKADTIAEHVKLRDAISRASRDKVVTRVDTDGKAHALIVPVPSTDVISQLWNALMVIDQNGVFMSRTLVTAAYDFIISISTDRGNQWREYWYLSHRLVPFNLFQTTTTHWPGKRNKMKNSYKP
jgi:hypothetical protein